jgi:DNA (cytosine-5)-methyltransferase 1
MKDDAPVAIDLFAGSGGLGEGLQSAGINVVLASELHPQPSLTYAINHPSTKVIVGDQTKMSDKFILKKLKELGVKKVDLIVGGPPCQGFSTAGKKNIKDPRNQLFRDYIRVVKLVRPKMFLIENVPGFKKMYGGSVYEEALNLLTELGYECKDTILDASLYGAPQRRKRFVMVGRIPSETSDFAFPSPTHQVVQPGNTIGFDLPVAPTVAEAIGDLAFLLPGWEAHLHQDKESSEFQKDRRNGYKFIYNHLATKHRPKTTEMFSHILEGKTISSVPAHIRSGKKTMARLNRHSISNTVLALPDDLIHYLHHRIPTVREMARLQTYDDDYIFMGKRTSGYIDRKLDVPQYTQVGNSVPPVLAKAIGIKIAESLGAKVRDLREIEKRRSLHQFIKGSSSYAGYVLDPEIEKFISLETVEGLPLPLPVTSDGLIISGAEPLIEWVNVPNPMRGQWSPLVRERIELLPKLNISTQESAL